MNIRLFNNLRNGVVALASLGNFAVGDTVFIGDSITQGGNFNSRLVASYRYQLFKNCVDNGVLYRPMGMTQGAGSGTSVTAITPNYRGVVFENVSEAAASGRAYQYSGHGNTSPLVGTNPALNQNPTTVMPAANRGPVTVKLGLTNPYTGTTNTYYNGTTLTTYTGATYMGTYGSALPNALCIMIGVNDIYDIQGKTLTPASAYSLALKSTREIVQAFQAYNPDIKVYVFGILPVGSTNGSYGRTEPYNTGYLIPNVASWSTGKSTVVYADVSKGFYATNGAMIDGIAGAHPSAQGELIVAGNIARVMEIGQRTMGYDLLDAESLPSQADVQMTPGTGLSVATTDPSGGVKNSSFTFTPGNGSVTWFYNDIEEALLLDCNSAESGSSSDMRITLDTPAVAHDSTVSMKIQMREHATTPGTNIFSIFLGNGATQVGLLRISQAGICWQETDGSQTLLYGAPTATVADAVQFMTERAYQIRMTYKVGAGYCVWLDDQLIAENKAGTTNAAIVNAFKNMLLFGCTASSDTCAANVSAISFSSTTVSAPDLHKSVVEDVTPSAGCVARGVPSSGGTYLGTGVYSRGLFNHQITAAMVATTANTLSLTDPTINFAVRLDAEQAYVLELRFSDGTVSVLLNGAAWQKKPSDATWQDRTITIKDKALADRVKAEIPASYGVRPAQTLAGLLGDGTEAGIVPGTSSAKDMVILPATANNPQLEAWYSTTAGKWRVTANGYTTAEVESYPLGAHDCLFIRKEKTSITGVQLVAGEVVDADRVILVAQNAELNTGHALEQELIETGLHDTLVGGSANTADSVALMPQGGYGTPTKYYYFTAQNQWRKAGSSASFSNASLDGVMTILRKSSTPKYIIINKPQQGDK